MKKILSIAILLIVSLMLMGADGCDRQAAPQSASGVVKAEVRVQTDKDGLTIEQQNVGKRILQDNKIGAIKHLYVISAYSGQVLIYSTVKGKVTSSGKRLTPNSINGSEAAYTIPIDIGGYRRYTTEVLQDDGTYGSSVEYLFWWDTKGVYHQHYVSGGQILHITDQPLAVKSVTINMQLAK